ncbi:MAG: hypothetical protein HUU12_11740 [Anaerolineales bacterium]|nr:hypothetical protein [Anaerolineales bacterium]NUQ60031.1 hypothetical protein [Anaerolineales bacterium]
MNAKNALKIRVHPHFPRPIFGMYGSELTHLTQDGIWLGNALADESVTVHECSRTNEQARQHSRIRDFIRGRFVRMAKVGNMSELIISVIFDAVFFLPMPARG